MKSNKKKKEKKLTRIPTINRRLFRMASIVCRENANDKCEVCGMLKGTEHANTGKPQRVEAHHVMSRSNKNSPLKFDTRNLICLCTEHHKTGKRSAHKHGLWFINWFLENRPEDAAWIIEHTDDQVNLQDRDVLQFIEDCLRTNKPLDFPPERLLIDDNNDK